MGKYLTDKKSTTKEHMAYMNVIYNSDEVYTP